MKPTPELAAETIAERKRLIALMENFGPEQWGTSSLCEGWRVREVVAHMTAPFRTPRLRMLGGLIRARFSFDRYADQAARADTQAMTDAEILASLRDNVQHPWQPPGGRGAGALSHDVIHGLDITEPLGLPSPPTERIALILDQASPRMFKYFGTPWKGNRLIATDADLSLGDGTPVRMPVKQILLVVTGRRDLADAPVTKEVQ